MTVAPLGNPRLKTTQRMVLPNISWPNYQILLVESRSRRASKFAYSRGAINHDTVRFARKHKLRAERHRYRFNLRVRLES